MKMKTLNQNDIEDLMRPESHYYEEEAKFYNTFISGYLMNEVVFDFISENKKTYDSTSEKLSHRLEFAIRQEIIIPTIINFYENSK
jgi:hypothetical protein